MDSFLNCNLEYMLKKGSLSSICLSKCKYSAQTKVKFEIMALIENIKNITTVTMVTARWGNFHTIRISGFKLFSLDYIEYMLCNGGAWFYIHILIMQKSCFKVQNLICGFRMALRAAG